MKNAYLVSSALLLCLTLSACMERKTPAPVTHLGLDAGAPGGAAIVRSGDNLWSISKRHNLPMRGIIEMNDLSPPYVLSAGQRLVLPKPVVHKVRPDDTLIRIARMYDVSLSEMVRNNALKSPYRINVGQILRIPAVTTARVEEKEKYIPPQRLEAVVSEPLAPVPVAREADYAAVKTSIMPAAREGFIWPVNGRIISSYGPKEGGLHNDGINIAAPKGTPVAAAADGIVAYVGNDLGSYGNLVLIRHGNGMVTAYAHLSSITVSKGMRVQRGQTIGAVGTSGTVANAQLHFEIRQGRKTIDPKQFLG